MFRWLRDRKKQVWEVWVVTTTQPFPKSPRQMVPGLTWVEATETARVAQVMGNDIVTAFVRHHDDAVPER